MRILASGRPARRWSTMAAASALFLLMASVAVAHVPGLEPGDRDGAVPMGGPDVSRATYGYLAPDEDRDEYTLTVDTAVTRTVGIIVPAYPEHAGFRPTLTVAPDEGDPVVMEDPGTEPRPREFEPFSLTDFWTGGEQEVAFEPGMGYTLTVEPGGGDATGRYVIVFGGPEEFGAADMLSTFAELPRIWFGAYGGAPFRWNWLAVVPVAVALGFLGALGVGAWRLGRGLLGR